MHTLSLRKSCHNARLVNIVSLLVFLALIVISISVGVADFSWRNLDAEALKLLWHSRLPRTMAIILSGISMAMCGTIMQVVLKNRFVEPSMVGATQSASLALLLMVLYFPSTSIMVKMIAASVASIIGMLLFLRLIKKIPLYDYLIIPLIGIVFSGIIDAVTTFLAHQTDTLQILSVWQFGDFSHVLAGRYELLWIVGGFCIMAYFLADKLTIIGLGDNIAKNLGLSREKVLAGAIGMVAVMSAVVVVTVGAIPFVGLVVPNLVSMIAGDNLRKSLPSVALFGACAVLLCDIIGRTIRYPFEVPVATIFGVLGAGLFLILLLKKPRQ